MSNRLPVFRSEDEGEILWFGGGLMTLKVTSAQAGGAFILLEDTAGRGKATPLHLHSDHDETFYVIEGEILVHIDGIEHLGASGAVVSIPKGTPHAFLVTSEQARFLVLVTPGTPEFEAFFREGGEIAESRTLPPSGLDIPRILVAAERTGAMKMLGPPPFARADAAARAAG